ncbi:MAG: hypothetical protein OEY23_03915 [Acidimicrobiia bacterium]|nr:hypothetical protein [Acidimicrobiia bacterium]
MSPRSQRPIDLTPVSLEDLPITPPVDRNIPAEAWDDAPPELLALGDAIGEPNVLYLRQIGPFVLWRAGPGTSRTATVWMALDIGDLSRTFTFTQAADGIGRGAGPSGVDHERFRTWKEDLQRDGRDS